jgi:hypothetical protein
MEGNPICSSSDGYWWAADALELEDTIKELEGRCNAVLGAVVGLRGAQERLRIVSKPTSPITIDSYSLFE